MRWRGDDESPWPTHERNPAVFATAGSVLIQGWDSVNEHAENRIAKAPAERRNRKNGVGGIQIISLPGGSRIGTKKTGCRNRWNCRLR